MDPLERPRTLTTPTHEGWSEAMRLAACEHLGRALSDDAMSICWAQWALETGRGKHCYNWNLGNVKAVAGQPYTVLRTFEFVDDGQGGKKRIEIDDRFRAFDTLEDGAVAYLGFLLRPQYKRAWERFEAGDAAGAAAALKRLGYYTAPEDQYTRGLVSLAAEYKRVLDGVVLPDTVPDWSPQTAQPVHWHTVDEMLQSIFAQKPYR